MHLERDWQEHDAGPVLRVVPDNDRRARRRSDLAEWVFVVALARCCRGRAVRSSGSRGARETMEVPCRTRGQTN